MTTRDLFADRKLDSNSRPLCLDKSAAKSLEIRYHI